MKCCDVTASSLRVPIEIQEEKRISDGMGGHKQDWVKVLSTRSMWKHGSMSERLKAMQLDSKVAYTVTIRYRGGIKADQRIVHGGKTFNIVGVANVEMRNRFIEMLVEEGEPA